MQKTLTNMDTWTRHNNIQFNGSKCKVLTITRKKSLLNFIYMLDNVEVEHVSTEKDIGVNITNSLNWNTHIHAITAKVNKLIGLLKRTLLSPGTISVNFDPLPVFQLLLPSAPLLLSTCFTFCIITLTYSTPVPGQLYDPAPAIPSF